LAEEDSEQQLVEVCELLLLQRCFRELLLEEFVTTLHLVSGETQQWVLACCWSCRHVGEQLQERKKQWL
jgi:hypothetical protein